MNTAVNICIILGGTIPTVLAIATIIRWALRPAYNQGRTDQLKLFEAQRQSETLTKLQAQMKLCRPGAAGTESVTEARQPGQTACKQAEIADTSSCVTARIPQEADLTFTPSAWNTFITRIKNGTFDHRQSRSSTPLSELPVETDLYRPPA
jgi:hypothetical protein